MKDFKILTLNIILAFIFSSCNNEKKENLKFKEQSSYDSFINNKGGVKINDEYMDRVYDSLANESINPYFDKEQWKKDAELYLKTKSGDIVVVESTEKSKNKTKYYRSNDIPKGDNDFEYSEYWRKEAYKLSKEFIIDKNSKSKNKKCTVTGFGLFQPELVKYIGNKKYLVKILCSYECDNGSNGENFVEIEAHYMSHNLWDIH